MLYLLLLYDIDTISSGLPPLHHLWFSAVIIIAIHIVIIVGLTIARVGMREWNLSILATFVSENVTDDFHWLWAQPHRWNGSRSTNS